MKHSHRLLAAAFAAAFFIAPAQAQNAGTVTNHAFLLGKGAGITGYTSLLCSSAQLAVGQSAADPICKTITGDWTLSAAGAATLATVNANVGAFGSATNCPTVTVNAKGLVTAASATTCTPAVGSITGFGTGVATFLATPSSANLRAALTDEVGTGAAYFVGGALGTPASGTLTNATGLPVSTGLTGGGTGVLTALGIAVNASGGIVSPTPTRAGDVIYWNGTNWTSLAGNNSGTQLLQENASGVPSWVTVSGTGTVTSVVCGTGLTGGTITTSGTCAVSLTTASNSLSGNVSLSSTGSYFDGPSMAQGTSGTWFASGTVSVAGGSAGDDIRCKLWDGTTVISSAASNIPVLNYKVTIALSGILASPAANIRISCQDPNNTTAVILFNSSTNSKDSTVSGFRIQ